MSSKNSFAFDEFLIGFLLGIIMGVGLVVLILYENFPSGFIF